MPSASFSPSTKMLSVEDAYPIKDELSANGYRWNPDAEWWEKRVTDQSQIVSTWDHLISLGVQVPTVIAQFVGNYHLRTETNNQPELALRVLASKMGLR